LKQDRFPIVKITDALANKLATYVHRQSVKTFYLI